MAFYHGKKARISCTSTIVLVFLRFQWRSLLASNDFEEIIVLKIEEIFFLFCRMAFCHGKNGENSCASIITIALVILRFQWGGLLASYEFNEIIVLKIEEIFLLFCRMAFCHGNNGANSCASIITIALVFLCFQWGRLLASYEFDEIIVFKIEEIFLLLLQWLDFEMDYPTHPTYPRYLGKVESLHNQQKALPRRD